MAKTPSTKTPTTPETKPFEATMGELEAIVGQLESGDLPLEQALAAFEQGVGLVRQLTQRLSEAESRVELLTRGAEGTVRLEALDDEADTDD
jgi:exodeoxyribonuclease VII small subunit